MNTTVIPELLNILPEGVSIETTDSLDSLNARLGQEAINGNIRAFFGTAMIQGNRLQFVGATSMKTLTDMALIDRSTKRATAEEVAEHTNRPVVPTHQRDMGKYLRDTACMREKFILPAFMLNFGVKAKDGDVEQKVTVIIYRPKGTTGVNCWPAILLMGVHTKLDVTDGAHRERAIETIIADKRLDDDQRAALLENSVAFTVVFEADAASAHQDFADCGKAKPIPQSIVITFDIRDVKNQRALELVKGSRFLRHYVDATANNVNLSARSSKIWSMSAMRVLVTQVVDHFLKPGSPAPEGAGPKWQTEQVQKHTAGLESFLKACVASIPVLAQLDAAIRAEDAQVTVGDLREAFGGDVLLRGIGMAILARAFVWCEENETDHDFMAAILAEVDWHVLTIDPATLDPLKEQSGAGYAQAVVGSARPLWSHMLTISEAGYRIRSTAQAADEAWKRIVEDTGLHVTVDAEEEAAAA